ncbi:MAG: type II toxin-antitoxin system VapC family toxin [Candidatus Marinimicrobia bacterium]|nr:type II toxin-antitoxin system VapC family toxin [Candidatus Neomarinimicrobiota bacterium]
MKRLKIYLDTSVINFLFAIDTPDFQKVTIDFFENYVSLERYIVYISDVVIREIEKTTDEPQKKKLLDIIRQYKLRILTLTEEADLLARIYIKEKIIPPRKIEDAQHIAIATCHLMDLLLSWNFKHLANINIQIKVKVINEKEGYFYPLLLTNPMEVIYESD